MQPTANKHFLFVFSTSAQYNADNKGDAENIF